jgi:hypothetical protein
MWLQDCVICGPEWLYPPTCSLSTNPSCDAMSLRCVLLVAANLRRAASTVKPYRKRTTWGKRPWVGHVLDANCPQLNEQCLSARVQTLLSQCDLVPHLTVSHDPTMPTGSQKGSLPGVLTSCGVRSSSRLSMMAPTPCRLRKSGKPAPYNGTSKGKREI